MRQRKLLSKIQGLKRADGSVCADETEDKDEVFSFHKNLYQSQGFSDAAELLAHVPVKISQEMNDELTKPFIGEEVKVALFQMAPSKAPGVDGYTAGFYQRHWSLLGGDVTKVVLDFLNGGVLPSGLNDTAITLIPKG